ncbi:tetratricopeptide (TPR) repeat protein [Natronocella acetinitrilica]|uniref:Tetratricopeptide (TPR) repeat protein n=1 Tax=Natronocella acetinitrilica TaxID=414046 RepID=A0AAE3KA46_9GAMM|nr:tetratricopeptide repeat protein [Natronocella acetinitrilica]MCP1672951.1 tetratricopeptide (TPR) repeat protein [Natronocella acetinitrilica]
MDMVGFCRIAWCLAAALALAACATVAPQGDSEFDAVDDVQILDRRPLPAAEDDLLYQLMVAEFAGARGRINEALEAYMAAMRLSDDPEIASRAARIALYADREEEGLEAARRWVELDPEDPAARQALALMFVRAGRPGDARRHLRELVLHAGDDAGEMVSGLSAALAREEDRGMVLTLMRNLSRDFPGLVEAQRALAQAALRADEPAEAAEAAARALEHNPDDRQLRTIYGQGLLESGQEEAAIQVFQQLMADYPDDGDLRMHLARLLLQAGRDEEALAQFEQLLDERPDDAGVLYAAGLLTLEAGRPEQARSHFERLVDLGERVDASRFLLGRIGEQTNDPEGAERWYRLVEGEQYVDAQLRLAIVMDDDGRNDEARAVLRDLRRRHPDESVRTYLIEGDMLRAASRYEESMRVYDRALIEHPGDLDLLYARALVAVYSQDVDQAEADLRRVLESEPDHAHALNALGYTLVDLTDRTQEGYELIRRAYEQEPQNAAILDSMGWALYRLGRHDEALEYLRRAYELMPDAEIGAHLGEVLWVEGRRDEARDVWREASDLEPDHPVLRETLERFEP